MPSCELVEELFIVKKAKLAAPIQQFCTSMMCAETSGSELSDSRDHVIEYLLNLLNLLLVVFYIDCIEWIVCRLCGSIVTVSYSSTACGR